MLDSTFPQENINIIGVSENPLTLQNTLEGGNDFSGVSALSSLEEREFLEILGTVGRDILEGTEADERIIGGFGRDLLNGGEGLDIFVYQNLRDAGDIIREFERQQDKIDLTDVLTGFGYTGLDPLEDGYVALRDYNGGTQVLLDADGLGGRPGRPFIFIENVTADELGSFKEHFCPHPIVENEPPTIELNNRVESLNENTDTTNAIKVAEIIIDDDGIGSNNLDLTGNDADSFIIVGSELFLKAGIELNFEDKSVYDVTVEVDDTEVGTTPDDTVDYSLNITEVTSNDIFLLEGNSFRVEERETIIIPNTSSVLTFSYENLNFDLTDTNNINDAFEIALIDAEGNTLVHTIDENRDSFLNITEEQPMAIASGTSVEAGQVTLNLTGLPVGEASLIFRLVNNDTDTQTSVTIKNIKILPGDDTLPQGVIPNSTTTRLTEQEINFSLLSDISGSINTQYQSTSFNEDTQVLFAEFKANNEGIYFIDSPLIVAIDKISDPRIQIIGNDGLTPDGLPYYDLRDGVSDITLEPNESTLAKTLQFYNPSRTQFTYDLKFFGQLNQAPEIINDPNLESIIDKRYSYKVEAIDPNKDSLSYSLAAAPLGMNIDAQTGLLSWTPTAGDAGNHSVTVLVDDGRGGETKQTFILSVITDPPNRPPIFTSLPDVDGRIRDIYEYQPIVEDADGDSFTFSLNAAPANMTIDSLSGAIEWVPTVDQLGLNNVELTVKDSTGEETSQNYQILVGAEADNNAPLFTSEPVKQFSVALPSSSTGEVNPSLIRLNIGESRSETLSLELPSEEENIGLFSDIVFLMDESGSMEGEQEWLGEMVLDLETALQDKGIGPNRYGLLGFAATIQQAIAGNANVRNLNGFNQELSVYGPGNQLVESLILEEYPVAEFHLPADGDYTVVLDKVTADSIEYDLRLDVETGIPVIPFGLDEIVSGTITAGEEQTSTFEASAGLRVYFDAISSSSNLIRVDLLSPSGKEVFNDIVTPRDAGSFTLPESGTYKLVTRAERVDGDYSFSLRNLSSTPLVSLDTPINADPSVISGTIEPNRISAFQLKGSAAQRLYFDSSSPANGSRWTLFGPENNSLDPENLIVDSRPLDQDLKVVLQGNATYWLVLEGADSSTASEYSFQVFTPETQTLDLNFGEVVEGSLEGAGDINIYQFAANAGKSFWYDGHADGSLLQDDVMQLFSPAGDRIFSIDNTADDEGIVTLPETGNYSLVVDANDVSGDYAFQMLAFEDAPLITVGSSATGLLNGGKETQIYEIAGTAGQLLKLSTTTLSGSGNWSIYSPGNSLIDSANLNNSLEFAVADDGHYRLVVTGSSETDPTDYGFLVSDISATPVTNSGLGVVYSDTLTAGEEQVINLDLSAGTRVLFDTLYNDRSLRRLSATLESPSGQNVFSTVLDRDVGPFLIDETGAYELTVRATAEGTYNFRLLDFNEATDLSLDDPTLVNLSVGQDIQLFKFAGIGGTRLFLNSLTDANGNWQLFFPGSGGTAVIPLEEDFKVVLPADGNYILAIDGNSTTPSNFSFEIVSPEEENNDLSLEEVITGSLSQPGEVDIYRFTTDSPGDKLWLDSLIPTSDSIVARLVSPTGIIQGDLGDQPIGQDTGTITLSEEGEYTLRIQGGDEFGDYSFRLLPPATAENLTDGSETSIIPNSTDFTRIFRFDNGEAGQKLKFSAFAKAAQLSESTTILSTAQGGREDGYASIDEGLQMDFRPGAAVNFIFVTDEPREEIVTELDFDSILTGLEAKNALLNVVVNAGFVDENDDISLGIDVQGNAYLADGTGGYTASLRGEFVPSNNPDDTTGTDYVDLALASGGAAWDLNQLREGGLTATSFTEALVNIKAEEISQQIGLQVIVSDPTVDFENLTRPLFGIDRGDTANFDVSLNGGDIIRSFELLFVRPESGIVVGSIPVVVNSTYVYPAQAVDPDGDPLTYTLDIAPDGLMIDSQTGELTWAEATPGLYEIQVSVSDGRGGKASQSFELEVTAGLANNPPVITSTAPEHGRTNRLFQYQVIADDDDDDPLSFFLTGAVPTGMKIDTNTGLITWTPGSTQTGTQTGTVRVIDTKGGEVFQSFTVDVLDDSTNEAPTFETTPPTEATVGNIFRYEAKARDEDGDPLTYDLALNPDGMAIDATSGVVAWQPSTADVGLVDVILRVQDGVGGIELQSFQINVTEANTAPVITSTPPPQAIVDLPYEYRVRAQDAEGDELSFRLNDDAPTGMAINPTTGVVTYTPSDSQLGDRTVTITVTDAPGAETSQNYTLSVMDAAPNILPEITSNPRSTVRLGSTFYHLLEVERGDGDRLSFSLETAPAGMTIDEKGFIAWTPTAEQFGINPVTVEISDGRDDQPVTQTFSLEVVSAAINTAPTIDSNPTLAATVARQYEYTVVTSDLDGDPVTLSLETAPTGMSLDALAGTLRWTPTLEQLGTQEVEIQSFDGQGGFASQSFTLTVRGVNLPPIIESTPVTLAVVDRPYTYPVRATDPEADPLSYNLVTDPLGMNIDTNTGLIQWSPEQGQAGEHRVEVLVEDGQGATLQVYTVEVLETAPNQPPLITSTPILNALPGSLYEYDVDGFDPDGLEVTFSLEENPIGMTIDPITGLIQWPLAANDLGDFTVTVVAEDIDEGKGVQSFTLNVAPNNNPIITSIPIDEVIAGNAYQYDLQAVDSDGDRLEYLLINGPSGLAIDELGRVTWRPEISDLGPNSVELQVTDGRGGVVRQAYDLTVVADTEAPLLELLSDATILDIGEQIIVQVQGTDNVGISTLDLTLDGVPIALNPGRFFDTQLNTATIPFTETGIFDLVATATDAAGNVGTTSLEIRVIQPNSQAPFVELDVTQFDPLNPVITEVTDIIGTVRDDDDDLAFYRLEYAPVNLIDLNNPGDDDPDYQLLAEGTDPIENGELGQIDPRFLANDNYFIRVIAEDASGNLAAEGIVLGINTEIKPSQFSQEFVDLSIPLTGIPIEVKRTYNSLEANQEGDFGFGWSLGLQEARIQESVALTEREKRGLSDPFGKNPLKVGSRVMLTNPEGQRVGFTLTAANPKVSLFGALWEPKFIADPGVDDELSFNGEFALQLNEDGSFTNFLIGFAFNPQEYVLTTKDGIRYTYDQFEGLEQIEDLNGNTLTFNEAGINSSTGQSITFKRDPQGRIVEIIDPEGNSIDYAYDANGDLISVIDRTDNPTTLVYDEELPHYLTEVIDPLNRSTIRSEYDEDGKLIRIIDDEGFDIKLDFDSATSTQNLTDALGNPFTYVFDEQGNVIQEIDALGGIIKREYDADNNLISETDQEDNTTEFTYDDRGNVLTQTDPLDNTRQFTYNANSQLLTETDPLGNTRTNVYDANGNLIQEIDFAGNVTTAEYNEFGLQTVLIDANNNQIQFTYNSFGNITSYTDGLGGEYEFTYDANGNPVSLEDPLDNVFTTTYDAEGRVISRTDAKSETNHTEYNDFGEVIAEIDRLGRRTEFRYNDRGLLTETIFPDKTPSDLSDNPREVRAYDAADQLIAITDEAGQVTHFVYDKAGRLVETILPDATLATLDDNPRTRTEYDKAGRVTAEIDERGNRTEFVYDKAGQVVLRRDALERETLFEYDAAGRQTSTTDDLGRITEFFYDPLGQLIETRFADGTTETQTYDGLGNLITQTDQANRTTHFKYDALGNLTEVIDALDESTEYEYDLVSNLVIQRDANEHITAFEYDSLNRQTKATLPLLQEATTTYDPEGNILTTIDFNGETITYEYDERNRLIAERFSDGTADLYTYTPTGQLATFTDKRGITKYEYDERDRLISRTEPDGRQISYAYDAAGNITTVTVPSGVTTYTYDELNRISTVTDPDNGITQYSYDEVGNLIETEFPNGVVETKQYNLLNRLTFLENKDANGVVLSSYHYVLDPVGNRLSIEEEDGRRADYIYDDLDRLIEESITDSVAGGRTISYVYDAVGNRLERIDSVDGTTTYFYDDNDRLLTETTNGETISYSYDEEGNLLTRFVDADNQITYEWNPEGELIAVEVTENGETGRIELLYDADGIRVSINVDGEETRFLIDQNQPFAQVPEEYNPDDGTTIASYVHGLDLISQEREGDRTFYQVDGLGSTRLLTDIDGNITLEYIYDAYGQLLNQPSSTTNDFQFTGEQFDGETGLTYLRARYYDPETGRFISRDPFEGFRNESITQHDYLYAANNPANMIDPTGEATIEYVGFAETAPARVESISAGGFQLRATLLGVQTLNKVNKIRRTVAPVAKRLKDAQKLLKLCLAGVGIGGSGGFSQDIELLQAVFDCITAIFLFK